MPRRIAAAALLSTSENRRWLNPDELECRLLDMWLATNGDGQLTPTLLGRELGETLADP